MHGPRKEDLAFLVDHSPLLEDIRFPCDQMNNLHLNRLARLTHLKQVSLDVVYRVGFARNSVILASGSESL